MYHCATALVTQLTFTPSKKASLDHHHSQLLKEYYLHVALLEAGFMSSNAHGSPCFNLTPSSIRATPATTTTTTARVPFCCCAARTPSRNGKLLPHSHSPSQSRWNSVGSRSCHKRSSPSPTQEAKFCCPPKQPAIQPSCAFVSFSHFITLVDDGFALFFRFPSLSPLPFHGSRRFRSEAS